MDVDAIAVAGIWWRQTPYGGDPLYRADPPSDGRWQRGETVGGLYFADSEETAWAECDAYRGVLAPSAARPEQRILCLFRETDEVPDAKPVRPALMYRRPPAPPSG